MTAPLVLLHGFTGAPESWADVRASVAADDVFAPALVGHDGTPGPAFVLRFEDEVDRVAAVIRERGLEKIHLVGYSMGARVALGLLVRQPGVVARATLIGVHPGLRDGVERAARRAADEARARLLETEGLDSFVAAWEALPLFRTQEGVDPAALARQRRIRLSHDPLGLAHALRAIGLAAMPDYGPELETVDVPVTVVAGERDPKFTALGTATSIRLPRSQLHIIEGAGHNVVLERPTAIARLLKEQKS